MDSLRSRILIVVFVLALGFYWMAPTLFPDKAGQWWMGSNKIVYGLDIQGGLHIVLAVDVEGVVKEASTRLTDTLKDNLAEKKINASNISVVDPKIGELKIMTDNVEGVKKYLDEYYPTELQIVDTGKDFVTLRYLETYLNNYKERVVSQAIETVRNRIDEFGVSEPSITAQGKNRILVQLPGIKDSQRAKELINKTARLDFMMLNESIDSEQLKTWISEAEKKGDYNLGKLRYSDYVERLNADLKGKLPEKTVVYFMKDESAQTLEAGKIPVALQTSTDKTLGGDTLKDAYVGRGEYGDVVVHITFDAVGTGKFAKLTGDNVGKYMAIVLDKVVKSHPVIQSKIGEGRGVITMGGRGRDAQKVFDEAQLISTALRAGALPASLQQLEERTVGPTLGQDSIEKGKQAAIWGTILVLIFMILYYRVMGVIADVALTLNLLLTIAVLASLGATLTLPGIAGFALTAGMAVDANVLILERIRDELRRGSGIQTAIREGYNRAFSAIFDGHITTLATCIVLIYYGTGPVRGFGVSMTIGLIISMFTSVFVTRVVVDVLVGRLKFNNPKLLM